MQRPRERAPAPGAEMSVGSGSEDGAGGTVCRARQGRDLRLSGHIKECERPLKCISGAQLSGLAF